MDRRTLLTALAGTLTAGLIARPSRALSPFEPSVEVREDYAAACGARQSVHTAIMDEIDRVLRQNAGSDAVFESVFSTAERERLLQLVTCPYCGCAAAEF